MYDCYLNPLVGILLASPRSLAMSSHCQMVLDKFIFLSLWFLGLYLCHVPRILSCFLFATLPCLHSVWSSPSTSYLDLLLFFFPPLPLCLSYQSTAAVTASTILMGTFSVLILGWVCHVRFSNGTITLENILLLPLYSLGDSKKVIMCLYQLIRAKVGIITWSWWTSWFILKLFFLLRNLPWFPLPKRSRPGSFILTFKAF